MAYTESQKKASIKYMSEKTDDIRLRVKKGLKEKYKLEAEKRGVSMTQFIIGCVEKEIKDSNYKYKRDDMAGKVDNMRRYLVIREQDGTLEDVHAEVYESLEEANNSAKYSWNHLTDAEQKKNHVFVAEVTESDLYEDAIEDGEAIDWTAYKQYNTPEGGFDSDEQ
ncbi:MAG: hypothetical protein MR945_09050 [Agathobacter sp.]|nr:hypothetical protein [Agathobacter sp.]